MKKQQNTEQRVRRAIAQSLKKVKATSYPNLYKRLSTANGYIEVESMIIEMMIKTGVTPDACINTLETDMP